MHTCVKNREGERKDRKEREREEGERGEGGEGERDNSVWKSQKRVWYPWNWNSWNCLKVVKVCWVPNSGPLEGKASTFKPGASSLVQCLLLLDMLSHALKLAEATLKDQLVKWTAPRPKGPEVLPYHSLCGRFHQPAKSR